MGNTAGTANWGNFNQGNGNRGDGNKGNFNTGNGEWRVTNKSLRSRLAEPRGLMMIHAPKFRQHWRLQQRLAECWQAEHCERRVTAPCPDAGVLALPFSQPAPIPDPLLLCSYFQGWGNVGRADIGYKNFGDSNIGDRNNGTANQGQLNNGEGRVWGSCTAT